MTNILSDDGVKLILDYEVSSEQYYNKFLQKPTVPAWQTTRSGVTIGIGWDCGYNTKSTLFKEWVDYLQSDYLDELSSVLGFTGKKAHDNLDKVSSVIVPYDAAINQFETYTIPRYYNLATSAYPGLDSAPQSVKDVIVSLTFNRGTSVKGDTRTEMLKIKKDIAKKNYSDIIDQLISMKRLWPNTRGLLERRDAESEFLRVRLDT